MEKSINPTETPRFEDVWQRILPKLEPCPGAVSPGPGPLEPRTAGRPSVAAPAFPAPSEGALLKELIEKKTALLTRYRQLSARYSRNAAAQALCRLARDTAEQLERLKTAFFILTGEKPPAFHPPFSEIYGLSEELRTLFWKELQSANDLGRAAEQSVPFSAILQGIAAGDLRKAEQIFTLASSC